MRILVLIIALTMTFSAISTANAAVLMKSPKGTTVYVDLGSYDTTAKCDVAAAEKRKSDPNSDYACR